MSKKEQIHYYKTCKDDFVESKDQDYKIKENYKWIHQNILYKICSSIVYFIAYIFSIIYCKLVLHIKIENKKVFKKYKKQGYFLYANHTQVFGDIFNPAYINSPKRIYVVVSQSNLGVVGIGKLLPMLGALPIPDTKSQMQEFTKAIEERIKQKKCVVIYPEAHLWPYYTKIRPFESTAFRFPVKTGATSFCMTTTYYKRKFFKKPGIKIYIDGPFLPEEQDNKKQAQENLHNKVYETMINRSKNSNYEYIKYREEK